MGMTHLVKLHAESEPFYAMTEWNKDQTSVEVKLLQKDKAWKFVLNGNDMGAVAKKLQVEESQATVWLREAFMGVGSSKHLFTIYDGDNYLVWKRHSDSSESRMRLRLGSFPMTEMTDLDAARSDFMECAVGAAAGKGGKDNELEERHKKLKEELRKCQKALKDMVNPKKSWRQTYTNNFCPFCRRSKTRSGN